MEYTLSEFRKKTREAFSMAEALDEVIIERYGLRYRLTREEDLPNNTVSFGSGLKPPAVKKKPTINPLSIPGVKLAAGAERCDGSHTHIRWDCGKPQCPWS